MERFVELSLCSDEGHSVSCPFRMCHFVSASFVLAQSEQGSQFLNEPNHSECLLVGFFHVVFGMCYIPSACVNDMPPPEKGRFVKPSVNMAAASCLYIVCRNDVLQT